MTGTCDALSAVVPAHCDPSNPTAEWATTPGMRNLSTGQTTTSPGVQASLPAFIRLATMISSASKTAVAACSSSMAARCQADIRMYTAHPDISSQDLPDLPEVWLLLQHLCCLVCTGDCHHPGCIPPHTLQHLSKLLEVLHSGA